MSDSVGYQRRVRKSIRLKGYDYSQWGAYFVTSCAFERAHLFGDVVGDDVQLNEFGEIAAQELLRTPMIRPEVELDAFVVMPNHIHAILVFFKDDIVGAHVRAPLHRPARSLGSLVAQYKGVVTARINTLRRTPGLAIWQRNNYEHVIRDDRELILAREYILNNPVAWSLNCSHPVPIEWNNTYDTNLHQ